MSLKTEDRYYRYPIKEYKEYKRIIYQPGRVTRIILNRPRYMNAMSHCLFGELEDAFDRASADPECHVIVLSGAGSCFSGGDDAMGLTPESAPVLVDGRPPEQLMKDYGSEDEVWHQYNIEHDHFLGWWPENKLHTIPKATIAMVHGYCIYMALGLATSMDIIFAAEDALFISAGVGGRLMWEWGPRKALEVMYEHRFLTARECLEYHMINRIYPDYETLERETLAYASRVADNVQSRILNAKKGFLNMMSRLGIEEEDAGRTGFAQAWRQDAIDGHRQRYEGRGRARTPVALRNLKAKLEGEGKKVPEHILAAVARAAQRDDKGTWQRALHQSWRDPERVARADASAKRYEEEKKAKEKGEKA